MGGGGLLLIQRCVSEGTHIVASLFTLVALLVGLGFGLIWLALLRVEGLPAFTEDLADLACNAQAISEKVESLPAEHTKADARVLLPHVFALLVGEEHIGGKTTFGRVGIYCHGVSEE